jgi:hypothetical protein
MVDLIDPLHVPVYGGAEMRLWPLLALVSACSGPAGPTITLKIAHGATGDGRCGVSGAQDPAVTSLSNVSRIRLTWRKHGGSDPKGTFLCDRVIKVGETPNLRLHVSGQQAFDLYAEGFAEAAADDPDNAAHGKFRRVASGGILNVPFNVKTIPPLRLYPVQKFGCVSSKMVLPRSFHTATALPNGQVLIVGGAVASTDGVSENLTNNLYYLTGSAEIYDPADGSFKEVQEDMPAAGRAFHQAFYVGTDTSGAFNVLLVGGVASKSDNSAAVGLTNSGVGGPRLVPFDTSQTIPSPLPTVGAKAQLITYDPVARHAVRTDVDGFDEAAFLAGASFGTLEAPDGFVVAGGVTFVDPLNMTQPAAMSLKVERGAEKMPRAADLAAGRLGPSLVVLDADRAVVWGGALFSTAAQAEVLSGLSAGGTPMTTALGLPGVPGTQFQTATLVASGADSQVLVTGGFAVDASGNASQPPPAADAVHLITLAADGTISDAAVPFGGGYVADASTCSNPSRYKPAGFESAVSLPHNRGILITGGAPTFDQNRSCNDCEHGASLLCSVRQTSIYQAGGSLSPGPDSLQVGRFGHASTLLSDGTLLITGGTTLPPGGGGPRVSSDAEVFNPRTFVPPYNTTDAMPVDLDDPIAGDLVSGLQRQPGGLAFMSSPDRPTARCEDLN